jgi:hypothetical protein
MTIGNRFLSYTCIKLISISFIHSFKKHKLTCFACSLAGQPADADVQCRKELLPFDYPLDKYKNTSMAKEFY